LGNKKRPGKFTFRVSQQLNLIKLCQLAATSGFENNLCFHHQENLKMLKIPTKLITLMKMTLTNSRAVVAVYQGRTDVFNINNGLREGDALSTVLFNLVLEAALLKTDLRGNISTRTKQLCAYADDVVIITRMQKALKETFITLQKEAEKLGFI